jgi:methylenetetrahydrofolate reductase (NADPH)
MTHTHLIESTRAQKLAGLQGRPPASSVRRLREDMRVSFEFFPPTSDKQEAGLWQCLRTLESLDPAFVSVTYGAGGTTQARTLDVVSRIAAGHEVPVAGHLTCVGASRARVDAVVEAYARAGVRRLVALRGDAPAGAERFEPHPDGYACAAELVAAVARRGDFDISVAAYPEVHPDAASADADLDNLKRKVDAGASRAITQFFFEPDVYLRFLERARAAGITVPIVPGILPVHNFANVKRFATRCGASVPPWLEELFAPLDRTPEVQPLVAATVCGELCARLMDHGVREFHFYTMNRPQLAAAVCQVLAHRVGRGTDAPLGVARAASQ